MEERDSHSNKNNSNGVNNIKIFTNGSKNDPPKKFVVSRKNYRTINSLMDNVILGVCIIIKKGLR